MNMETRKSRAKILKRILNSLTVEINELKARGESDTEDLDIARNAITRYSDKLCSYAMDSTRAKHPRPAPNAHHHYSHPTLRAA
jgi:hypothetical protein